MPLYQKVTNDETGEESYIEVQELPDEEVTKSKAYKKLADRDFKRRKRIEELKAKVEGAGAEEPEHGEETPDAPEGAGAQQVQQPVVPAIDPEALYTDFITRYERQQAERAAAAQAEKATLEGLLSKYSLTDDALPLLANAKNPEEQAKLLQKSRFRFDDVPGGAVPGTDGGDATFSNIMSGLGLADTK